MIQAAALNWYDGIFGFDQFLQAHFTQKLISDIHYLELEEQQSLLGKSELIAWNGDLFNCSSLNGVHNVFLFNGYTLLLQVTLYLCALSRTVKSLRVALIHPKDLVACGVIMPDKESRNRMSVRMLGSGLTYSGFYLEMTPELQETIMKVITSNEFMSKNPSFKKKSWTIGSKTMGSKTMEEVLGRSKRK